VERENKGLTADDIGVLLHRLLADEPGFVLERRPEGHCFFCRGRLGKESKTPRLFAVAADGGLLLRMPEAAREAVLERKIGSLNPVLPEWVLRPPRTLRPTEGVVAPRHQPSIHGDPMEWVWIPIRDPEAFERRRPHVLETLEYCRFSLEEELEKGTEGA
jgi:hypothetical protein